MSSPSTLIRRARLAESRGHRHAAKKLREQASKLRRIAREAKNYATSKAAERAKTKRKKPLVVQGLIETTATQERSLFDDAVDRVLGPDVALAQRIAMRRELVDAHIQGENNAAAKYGAQAKMNSEGHAISMVSSLIAIVEHSERLNGSLPPTMVLPGYMVAKVVDALRKAGYTRDGLNGGGIARENIRKAVGEKPWEVYSGPTGELVASRG